MSQAERDKRAYWAALHFLANTRDVEPDDLMMHLQFAQTERPVTLPHVYEQLLWSAQSPGMMPAIISKSIPGAIPGLKSVLCGFDPKAILSRYGNDWERLLNAIIAGIHPRGKVRREKRSIWPRFCRTALSGAAFLSRFEDLTAFHKWVSEFPGAPADLPRHLAEHVVGFGFAVAADFLKGMGYVQYAKPDVHLRDMFTALGLCGARADDYQLYDAIVRVGVNVGQSPYHVDKLFWLIGSGNFHVTRKKLPGRKREFLDYAKRLGLC